MDGSYNTNNILSVSHTTDRSLSISPSLTIPVDDNWSLSVASTYARSRNRRQTASSSNGTVFLREDFRSEEHTYELQSLMRISYAVFCLKNKKHKQENNEKLQRNMIN